MEPPSRDQRPRAALAGAAAGLPGPRAEGAVLAIPANALVVLVGASGSGKSTWAREHFRGTEVVSSDRCRALVADDEADQRATGPAFRVFHEIIRQRLFLGRLTVADSTALSPVARERLRDAARRTRAPCLAVVFDVPIARLLEQNRRRERRVPEEVIERHALILHELVAERRLEAEDFDAVHHLAPPHLPRPAIVPPRSILRRPPPGPPRSAAPHARPGVDPPGTT